MFALSIKVPKNFCFFTKVDQRFNSTSKSREHSCMTIWLEHRAGKIEPRLDQLTTLTSADYFSA